MPEQKPDPRPDPKSAAEAPKTDPAPVRDQGKDADPIIRDYASL